MQRRFRVVAVARFLPARPEARAGADDVRLAANAQRSAWTVPGIAARPVISFNPVVNDPFKALSHPIRRGIVERLAAGPATVGDATGGFGVSKPAISKHLKVLEETGVVTRVVEGRTHRLSLEPDVLSEAGDWMDRQRAL